MNSVYLDLTFITLAMLVVGGASSLFGAVVGALAVSALDSWLAVAENGTSLFGWHIDLPAGTRRDRRRGADGGGADPAAVRAHGRTRASTEEDAMARVCVAGAGVIGSLFAAHLARVADVSALTRREEHAARAAGATACGSAGAPTSRRSLSRGDRSRDELPEPELVILACKGTDLEAVAARLAGHWPDATVMTVQNGIGADEIVARHGDWPLLVRGHVHERHAPRGHARAVRARHRDVDRPGARHHARRRPARRRR